MARFIARLHADSLVRLGEKPYYKEFETSRHIFEVNQDLLVLFDNVIAVENLYLPKGLVIQADCEALDIDKALHLIRNLAIAVIGMHSMVARASIGVPQFAWIYESSSGQELREVVLFVYDPALTLKTRTVKEEDVSAVWAAILKANSADPDLDSDDKERLGWAFSSVRRGLADNDDLLTEFVIHWTAAEALDKMYRQRVMKRGWHGKRAEYLNGIEHAFERLGERSSFAACHQLRDSISHGLEPLAQVSSAAAANMELIRRVSVLMTLSTLLLPQPTVDSIVGRSSFKGHYAPHIRLRMRGKFDPGDARQVAGHPEISPERVSTAVSTAEDTISLSPSWRFHITSPGQYRSPHAIEVWGEQAAETKIEMNQPEIIKTETPEGPQEPRIRDKS